MSKDGIRIEALQVEDVPVAAELLSASFEDDRQTQMKKLGQKEPFDLRKFGLEAMPGYIKSPRCVFIKAVDEKTGELAGFCNWGFKGFQPADMPIVPGRMQPSEPEPQPNTETCETGKKANTNQSPKIRAEESASTDPIERLQQLTSRDLNEWMSEVMEEAPRCMYVIFLAVSPKYQGRGIGKALLQWGTGICEKEGIFAWVSSSQPAWLMYQKSGFEVVRELDVDLDEYAPCSPPSEGNNSKWGHYTFRYMKYLPNSHRA